MSPSAGGRTDPVRNAPDRSRWFARPLLSYYLILASAGVLATIGLVMVLSASSVTSYAASGSSFTVFGRQVVWVCVGLPALWVGSRLPTRVFRMLGYPLLLGSAVLLVLVLVPGVGRTVYGATRWIDLPGSVQYQPSEAAKLALALWGADLLVRKRRLLGEWRHLLVPLVPVAAVFAGLVMLEPDLGTTLVLIVVVLALLFVVGAPGRLFGAVMVTAGSVGVLLIATSSYRMARVTAFLDPFADPQGTGFQAVQGLYALSSGGWFGVGLGASRQKWAGGLPNANTDYIFAIVGEELGLVGTVVVLLLFAVLAYAGIRVARRTFDPFERLAAAAVTAWLLGQALINIGAVVGLLPITGIPLPLISFGGSALVVTMFAIGMLASFARREPGAAAALAARRAAPSRGLLRGRRLLPARGSAAPSGSVAAVSPGAPVPVVVGAAAGGSHRSGPRVVRGAAAGQRTPAAVPADRRRTASVATRAFSARSR